MQPRPLWQSVQYWSSSRGFTATPTRCSSCSCSSLRISSSSTDQRGPAWREPLAISIKLVPVGALVVVAAAVFGQRRRTISTMLGCVAVLTALWLPVVLNQWPGFTRNVLAYKGVQPEETRWGIVDIARHTHHEGVVDWLVGPGRFLALAVSALVPAVLVFRRRDAIATGVALSLALFLLLTTAFGTQYLAWAAAAVLLLDVWAGTIYNLMPVRCSS